MLRGATIVACLLCLTCSGSAQNLNSTAFANLTVIRQNDANFSSNLALPSFPCGASSPGLVGGYKSLDLDDIDLYYVTQYVLNYYTTATSNLTDCDIYGNGAFNITDACSQVVRGTNYAIEVESGYRCLGDSDTETDSVSDSNLSTLSLFGSLLRATVYLPLPEASSDPLDNSVVLSPVIRDIWFEMPPEVLSYNLSALAAAPAAAAAAAAASSTSPSSGNTSTTLLTGDSGVGSSTGTLQFVPSPAAQASPASQSEPVTGLDVEDQEQSIASG